MKGNKYQTSALHNMLLLVNLASLSGKMEDDSGSCLFSGAQQVFQLLQRAAQILSIILTSSRVSQLSLEICHLEHTHTHTREKREWISAPGISIINQTNSHSEIMSVWSLTSSNSNTINLKWKPTTAHQLTAVGTCPWKTNGSSQWRVSWSHISVFKNKKQNSSVWPSSSRHINTQTSLQCPFFFFTTFEAVSEADIFDLSVQYQQPVSCGLKNFLLLREQQSHLWRTFSVTRRTQAAVA